LRNLKLLPFNN